MAENPQKPTENGSDDDRIEVVINYVKSNFFRVIHADGAWGGTSPSGDIHMAFYNERSAIPDASRFTVSSKTAQIVKPEEYEASSSIVREVEADVVLDLNTAIKIRAWLDDKITHLQSLISEAQQEKGS